MLDNFFDMAAKILGKKRSEAESLLLNNYFSAPEAAEVVAAHTFAKSQRVFGSPREVALTMVNVRSLTLRLQG